MPCANYVAKSVYGWNKSFLTQAEKPELPTGIAVELTGQTADEITVEITNESGTEWDYGYAYTVQVLLDEVWYEIPAERDMSFIEILLMIPDGVSTTES